MIIILNGNVPLLLTDIVRAPDGSIASAHVSNGGWRLVVTADTCFARNSSTGFNHAQWPKPNPIKEYEVRPGENYNDAIERILRNK